MTDIDGVTADNSGAMTALRAERKLRKEAEREADHALANLDRYRADLKIVSTDLDRTRTLLAQAQTEIRQLRVDLNRASDDAANWRKAAQARGKALSSANQTTNMLAKLLSERTTHNV